MSRIGFVALLAALALWVLPPARLAAQSNAFVDRLLETPQATLGQAAYLLLTARGVVPEKATPEQAAETLAAQGWDTPALAPADPVTLGQYCFLLMQAYAVQGGLMYRIAPGPRYASRELAYRRLIRGKAYPNRTLSGEEALAILRGLLEQLEAAGQAAPAPKGGAS
jgi:hypothetical protein